MTVFTTLPTNYREALYYPLTSRRLLILLNIAATIPLLLFGGAMFVYWAWYLSIGAPCALGSANLRLLPTELDVLGLLAVLLITFPLHELCHGLAFKLLGVEKVKYGIIPRRFVLYAEPEGEAYFYRNGFFLSALMPLILITLGGVVLLPFVSNGARLALSLAVAVNAAGSIGDIWTVIVILSKRFPPDSLARDLGDTFVVYTPVQNKQEESI